MQLSTQRSPGPGGHLDSSLTRAGNAGPEQPPGLAADPRMPERRPSLSWGRRAHEEVGSLSESHPCHRAPLPWVPGDLGADEGEGWRGQLPGGQPEPGLRVKGPHPGAVTPVLTSPPPGSPMFAVSPPGHSSCAVASAPCPAPPGNTRALPRIDPASQLPAPPPGSSLGPDGVLRAPGDALPPTQPPPRLRLPGDPWSSVPPALPPQVTPRLPADVSQPCHLLFSPAPGPEPPPHVCGWWAAAGGGPFSP